MSGKTQNFARNLYLLLFRAGKARNGGWYKIPGRGSFTLMNTLGSRIKLARGRESQESFAARAALSKGSLGGYERDENSPSAEAILKICSGAEISVEWLMTGRGPMRPQTPADGTRPPPQSSTPSRASQKSACTAPAVAPTTQENACSRCERLDLRLEEMERERRELTAENRQLWRENATLREENAMLRERQYQQKHDSDSAAVGA